MHLDVIAIRLQRRRELYSVVARCSSRVWWPRSVPPGPMTQTNRQYQTVWCSLRLISRTSCFVASPIYRSPPAPGRLSLKSSLFALNSESELANFYAKPRKDTFLQLQLTQQQGIQQPINWQQGRLAALASVLGPIRHYSTRQKAITSRQRDRLRHDRQRDREKQTKWDRQSVRHIETHR